MNLSDIIRQVRNLAGDVNVLQFTDDMVTDWANNAVKDIVISNALCQKDASSNLVVGTTEYTLPTDIFKLHSVLVDSEKIPVLSMEQHEAIYAGSGAAQAGTDSGRISHCHIWAGKLHVFPKPDQDYSLKIRYIYEPAPLDSGDDTPDIPTAYHNRIVTYCLAQVAFLDEDVNKYQRLLQEFNTGVIDLRTRADQEEDVYPSVSVSTRDMGEWYDY